MKRLFIIALFLLLCGRLAAQELYDLPKAVHSTVASPENSNGEKDSGGKTNNGAKGSAFISLKAGETKTLLDTKGAGMIQRLWFTLDDRTPEMLKGLRFKIYWDNGKLPAVDVPFGDFFCAAVKPVAFESALFSDPEGRSFNCYIPMSFKTSARITLCNNSGKDLAMLFYDIDLIKSRAEKSQPLYFHTHYNDKTYPPGQDVELLNTKGTGRFLGVSMAVKVNPAYGNTWWGEGEVKIYLDGDTKYPTINGTGAEDYLGTGWMLGTFAHRYQGCLVASNGQYAFYRFHIPDAIYFYHDFKATIQQIGGWFAKDVKKMNVQAVSLSGKKGFRGMPVDTAKADDEDWMNFYRSDNYAVTAYYYLNRP